MKRFAVFGHPISHSRSPEIHARFAEQTRVSLEYRAIDVPIEDFSNRLSAFRETGGVGLNCTLPLKEVAFRACQSLSEAARLSGAANTLLWTQNNQLHGDNTDGTGLVRDLTENLGLLLENQSVLILGAGGATRGIIYPLLKAGVASLWIANRSEPRALDLLNQFEGHGPLKATGFDALEAHHFDLILNATSASLAGHLPPVPDGILSPGGNCYDLAYGKDPTPFVLWGQKQGARLSADGIGMLVEQAAEAFFIWHGLRPDTAPVIKALSGGARILS